MKSTFHTKNRRKLVENIDEDALLVVAGNGLMQRTGDTHYPFRQDSSMYYFTGINEPDCILVIDAKNGHEYIGIPRKSQTEILFGGKIDEQHLSQVSGVESILPVAEILQMLARNKHRKVYLNIAPSRKSGGLFINPARSFFQQALRRRDIAPHDLRPYIMALRCVKQPEEIDAIEHAISMTMIALHSAKEKLHEYSESALLRCINENFAKHGINHAYEPIVAAGRNATILHYTANNDSYKNSDAVLFDVGAEVDGYAADISRTYVAGTNQRIEHVIEEVERVQHAIIETIQPGMTWQELSNVALRRLSESLKALGLSNDPKRYFTHAIGHFLGLDVHDVGDYTKQLQPGMVITIEPGLYIREEVIGVRIEDDIVVTENGARILGS